MKIALLWSLFIIVSLALSFLTSKMTFFKMDAVALWVVTVLYFLYAARGEIEPLSNRDSMLVILLGIGLAIFSFVSIPLGIGNPPYSIGDLSILLSGISLMFAAILKNRNYLLPLSIPAIGVLGFEMFDLFVQNQEWLSSPLIPHLVGITILTLNMLGITAHATGNMVSLLSADGKSFNFIITSDCSGLWSLGTFTLLLLIVFVSFKRPISPKWVLLVGVGYVGTVLMNIFRILAVALAVYVYGDGTIIGTVHMHTGWILFYTWMIIFWYVYFTRYLGFPPPSILKKLTT